ncbi:MAG: tRNA pseudouridine(13) synthase TruD [Marinobacter sp.]|uniref:tRNA pseudouridine(13) synthase TruD n=1 Tax=Marinobacter sp. TaxID=50741 RepID=UPI00299DC1CD|nr:tRNA pseudouridine(13) synthase TruD [Marinobacter sp.]MDX1635323.1 tRNA pseudouridine(13) synthase TruD [Marinobacter sp.]
MSEPRWRLAWPGGQGAAVATADFKTRPEDFLVDEILAVADQTAPVEQGAALPGQGEHLYLRLEKTGDNSDYVSRELAALSGCQPHEVGLCGLKDRHAVTRQWFSVQRPGREVGDADFIAAVAERWPVLAAGRFLRKLRRGEHQGNRFELLLRQVSGDRQAIETGLERLRAQGCPNYYGPQRFGWQGSNLDQACRLRPGRRRGRDRRQGLYFSAARSWLFNEVLAERVLAGNWHQRLEGEPVNGEVTGPLWGDGGTLATGAQGELERQVVAAHPALASVFSQTRMKPERRALVLRPRGLEWYWPGPDSLRLEFELAPGQFATSLLADVFQLRDASKQVADLAESE